VRLARPAGANEQHVLAAVEVLSLYELQHLWLVDAGPRCEVELVQELVGREACGLQSPLRRFTFPLDQLQFTQLQQERQVISIIPSCAGRDLLALGVHGGELEGLEMMLQQDRALGLDLVHEDTSSSKA
jgi:hypothetical protein